MIKGSIYTHGEGDELSKAEKMALESLSIEEAKLRRIELQKHRHLQGSHLVRNFFYLLELKKNVCGKRLTSLLNVFPSKNKILYAIYNKKLA